MVGITTYTRLIQIGILTFLGVSLILFAGLRSDIDPDYWNYVLAFNVVPDISRWLNGDFVYSLSYVWMEPGYLAFTAFVKLFTDDTVILFLSVAALSVGLACYNYYKISVFPIMSTLLFFSHTYLYRDMIQIRAAVACAIGLFVLRSLSERKYVTAAAFAALAASFHLGAIIYFAVFPIFLLYASRRIFTWIVLLGFAVGAAGAGGMILSSFAGAGLVGAKIAHYEGSSYANSIAILDITNLKNLFLCLGIFVFWNRFDGRVPHFYAMAIFFACATAWRIGFAEFGIVAARIATFFSISEVLLIPAFILFFKPRFAIAIVIVAYAFLTMYQNLSVKGILDAYEVATT